MARCRPDSKRQYWIFLTRLKVTSSPLEKYISERIKTKELTSPYYCGTIPTLYFIALWYRGSQKSQLGSLVLEALQRPQDPLHKAMLITAACSLEIEKTIIQKQVGELLSLKREDGWPATALYYEPPQGSERRYAGSPELTTAFAIEALNAHLSYAPLTPAAVEAKPRSMQTIYNEQIMTIQKQNRIEVIDPAGIMQRALGVPLPQKSMNDINRASIDGWAAYTFYDDLLDGEADIAALGAANMAMRRAVNGFLRATNHADEFAAYVERAFVDMDSANTWELLNARNPKRAPDYSNLEKLANRSAGHILAYIGSLVIAGFALNGAEVQAFKQFMKHYIIAKQLCDDAHDWDQDLARGHMSVVASWIAMDCKGESNDERRLHFWQHTILKVNRHVRAQLQKARQQLQACAFIKDTSDFELWLEGIEEVCVKAEAGRDDTKRFISAFTGADLIK